MVGADIALEAIRDALHPIAFSCSSYAGLVIILVRHGCRALEAEQRKQFFRTPAGEASMRHTFFAFGAASVVAVLAIAGHDVRHSFGEKWKTKRRLWLSAFVCARRGKIRYSHAAGVRQITKNPKTGLHVRRQHKRKKKEHALVLASSRFTRALCLCLRRTCKPVLNSVCPEPECSDRISAPQIMAPPIAPL